MALAHRPLFFSAAAFNVAAGMPLLLAGSHANALLDLRLNASGIVMLQIIAAIAVTFGVAYAMVGIAPHRNRPLAALGAVLKLMLASSLGLAWWSGLIGWQLPALTVADIVYGVLFIVYLKQPVQDNKVVAVT